MCSAQSKGPEKLPAVAAGVEIRWRPELRDNADQRPEDDFERFLGHRLRAFVRLRPHAHLSLFVQGQDVWLPGARADKVVHDFNTNLHQAYFDWRPGGSLRWEFRGGRQELSYGEERLLGVSNWDNVGRAWDAARLRYRAGAWSSDFFGGRLADVRRGGARFRAAGQDLFGAHVSRGASGDETQLYALFLNDGLRTAGRPTRIATFGFRRNRLPKAGWRYMIEHAWQAGRRGPDAHRAAMLASSAGHTWGGRRQPRVFVEYDFSTGDGDARDGRSREFHNLFPTNHGHYGYIDVLGLRNMHAARLDAAFRAHPKAMLELDYWNFFLADARGPWKNDGGRVLGQDPAGRSGRHIGQEFDLTLRVPLQAHVNLQAGYSVFLPGAFARRTRGPEIHHFGYLQTTLTF